MIRHLSFFLIKILLFTLAGWGFLITNPLYAQVSPTPLTSTEVVKNLSLKEATEAAGISLDYLARQERLSRYDLTRLLNAVECQDCINPSPTFTDNYTAEFRSSFITIPGEDFRDILYQQ